MNEHMQKYRAYTKKRVIGIKINPFIIIAYKC